MSSQENAKKKLWAKQKDDHTKAAKFWKDKNEKKCRGAVEIYDEHDNIIKRIFDAPS